MDFFHARARGLPYVAPGGRVLRFKLGLHPSIPRGTLAIPRGTLAGEWRKIHELRGNPRIAWILRHPAGILLLAFWSL